MSFSLKNSLLMRTCLSRKISREPLVGKRCFRRNFSTNLFNCFLFSKSRPKNVVDDIKEHQLILKTNEFFLLITFIVDDDLIDHFSLE
jgi:hypothetical protein